LSGTDTTACPARPEVFLLSLNQCFSSFLIHERWVCLATPGDRNKDGRKTKEENTLNLT